MKEIYIKLCKCKQSIKMYDNVGTTMKMFAPIC